MGPIKVQGAIETKDVGSSVAKFDLPLHLLPGTRLVDLNIRLQSEAAASKDNVFLSDVIRTIEVHQDGVSLAAFRGGSNDLIQEAALTNALRDETHYGRGNVRTADTMRDYKNAATASYKDKGISVWYHTPLPCLLYTSPSPRDS